MLEKCFIDYYYAFNKHTVILTSENERRKCELFLESLKVVYLKAIWKIYVKIDSVKAFGYFRSKNT